MFVDTGNGLIVHLIIIFALQGEGDNLNVKATLLHVIGDVEASAGIIIAGIIITLFVLRFYFNTYSQIQYASTL